MPNSWQHSLGTRADDEQTLSRNRTPAFKTKVALAAVRATESSLGAADVFGPVDGNATAVSDIDVKSLHAKSAN